jgi:hypothetical protein
MSIPSEVLESLRKFHRDYSDPKRVGFIMMKFSNTEAHNQVVTAVREVFKRNGITLLRADDFQYHSDLFLNILTYMCGCGFGIAIFERIESDDFNPNVSLEVGYMMGLGKPICYLKDKTLRALPTDIIGKLYVNFDPYNPSKGLEDEIKKWLLANDMCLRCYPCSIEIALDMSEWQTAYLNQIVEGFELLCREGDKPIFRGIRSERNSEFLTIDFDANELFIRKVKSLHEKRHLDNLAGLRVVNVTSDEQVDRPPETTYIYQSIGSEADEFLVQFCLLSSFDSLQNEAEEAKKVLPQETNDPAKCAIYVTKQRDIYYFHSNFRIPGYFYPTKLIATKFNGLKNIYPLILGDKRGSIFVDDKLLINHIKNVRYIFNKKITIDSHHTLPFDTFGATKLEFVSI